MLGAEDILSAFPTEKIGLVGGLVAVVVILWRLIGKLSGDKDVSQKELVQFYKDRAAEAVTTAQNYATVINGITNAIDALTAQLAAHTEILKDIAHELEKRGS